MIEPNLPKLPTYPIQPDEWVRPSAIRIVERDLGNEIAAQTIRKAIAYLKTTPAVTLVGKGGAYELLEEYANKLEETK